MVRGRAGEELEVGLVDGPHARPFEHALDVEPGVLERLVDEGGASFVRLPGWAG